MSGAKASDFLIGVELGRHAKTLPRDHPDREKFVLESARLRAGLTHSPSALADLAQPYEIPHEALIAREQAHVSNKQRFERHCLREWGEGPHE